MQRLCCRLKTMNRHVAITVFVLLSLLLNNFSKWSRHLWRARPTQVLLSPASATPLFTNLFFYSLFFRTVYKAVWSASVNETARVGGKPRGSTIAFAHTIRGRRRRRRLAVLETIKVSTTMRTHSPLVAATAYHLCVCGYVLITCPQAGTPRKMLIRMCTCLFVTSHISFFTYVALVRHSVTSICIYIHIST